MNIYNVGIYENQITKWNMLQKHRIDMSYCKFRVYWVSANTKSITLHIQVNIYYIESLLFTLDWSWTLDPYTEVTLLAVALMRCLCVPFGHLGEPKSCRCWQAKTVDRWLRSLREKWNVNILRWLGRIIAIHIVFEINIF